MLQAVAKAWIPLPRAHVDPRPNPWRWGGDLVTAAEGSCAPGQGMQIAKLDSLLFWTLRCRAVQFLKG